MQIDKLAARMKFYESDIRLPKGAVIVRVDGKAFHTWTKWCEKPFDSSFSDAMIITTTHTFRELQGCRLAYTQSDEASFLLTNIGTEEGLFGYKASKLTSVVASIFSVYFNKYWGNAPAAYFDARAFSITMEDAANNFVWRQRDCYRNYIQGLGRYYLGVPAIYNRNTADVAAMLLEQNLLDEKYLLPQYGVFIADRTNVTAYVGKKNYYEINEMAGINVTE